MSDLVNKQYQVLREHGFTVTEIKKGIMREPILELRDKFAMASITTVWPGTLESEAEVETKAKMAYRMADVMMIARDR
jgi:hypothetical protein